jgi:glycosyltransferase involved in cell wall biosynthesis
MAEPYMPLAALAAGKRPLAMMAYGTWSVRPLKRRSLGWLFRWAFGRADSTISISCYTLARMSEFVNLRHTVVCTGGVHVEDFQREVPWQPPAWARGAQIALGVGVLKQRKGYHVALEAIAQASQSLPNLHYVILGRLDESSGYVRNLRQRITALGLEDRVHLLGRVDFETLVGWYRRADVMFQLPVNVGDSFEGLGLTYYEAGVSGTPSVATLDCGSAEAVLDGETGFLVPQNDPQAAADALVRLLSDEALHARLGQGARRWAEKQTWAQVAQTVMHEYERLLAR